MKVPSNTTLHSIEGAARKLGVSHQTVRNWLSRKDCAVIPLRVDEGDRRPRLVLTGDQLLRLETFAETFGSK